MDRKVVRTISASEFKAKCLSLLDELAADGGVIVITKRGREVGRLHGPQPSSKLLRRAHFKDLLAGPVGDVVTPLDVEWKAMNPWTRPISSLRRLPWS